MTHRQIIGANIETLRKRVGMPQAILAGLVGLSQPQISKVENGTSSITAEQLFVISCLFDVPLNSFFTKPKAAKRDA